MWMKYLSYMTLIYVYVFLLWLYNYFKCILRIFKTISVWIWFMLNLSIILDALSRVKYTSLDWFIWGCYMNSSTFLNGYLMKKSKIILNDMRVSKLLNLNMNKIDFIRNMTKINLEAFRGNVEFIWLNKDAKPIIEL